MFVSGFFVRIKNLLLSPMREWETISGEPNTVKTIALCWLLPLSCFVVGATMLAYGLSGISFYPVSAGAAAGVSLVILYISSIVFSAFLWYLFVPLFGGARAYNRAFALAAYSFTPVFLINIAVLIPDLGLRLSMYTFSVFALICGLYTLYRGVAPMMGVAKHLWYFVLCAALALGVLAFAMFVLFFPLVRQFF